MNKLNTLISEVEKEIEGISKISNYDYRCKNDFELEKEFKKYKRASKVWNKEINFILNMNSNWGGIVLDIDETLVYLLKAKLLAYKEAQEIIQELLKEIGEKFYYHSDIDGVSLRLNDLAEYQEFKEDLKIVEDKNGN